MSWLQNLRGVFKIKRGNITSQLKDVGISQKSRSMGGYISLHQTGLANWSSRNYLSMSREGFMRNPIAHRAIRMISETAANVPWTLFEGNDEFAEHPALKLIQTPNNQSGSADFLEGLYGHLLLSGNAFVKTITDGDTPLELHALRPDRIRVISGRDGWPEAFEYQVGNHKERYDITTDNRPQILHLKLFHPLDDHMGFAPLEAALMALDLHNSASGWNKALLDNSARPSGALVYQPKDGGNLTQDQFDRLKSELEEGYSGVQKAGKPLLLGIGTGCAAYAAGDSGR